MANALQLRRGTTTQHSTFTGLAGEVTVDTTKDTVVVHDGSTAGGIPLATESYVGTEVANLVDSAPSTLDTLNELAAALGDDPNFATTVTNSIAAKMPLSGGTFSGNVTFNDNVKAVFGTGSDLQIYHNGGGSFIDDAGTGNLHMRASDAVWIQNAAGTATYIYAANANKVRLYHNNVARLDTSSTGVEVFGDIDVSGELANSTNRLTNMWFSGAIDGGDNAVVRLGNSDDLQIYHDGTNSYVKEEGTGELRLGSNNVVRITKHDSETSATFTADGSVELYHNNSKKFETTSSGVDVIGNLNADDSIFVQSASGYANLEMGGPAGAFIDMKVPYSDDYDARLIYDGTKLEMITSNDQAIKIRHNGNDTIVTSNTGVEIGGNLTVNGQLDIEEVHELVTTSSATSGVVTYNTQNQAIIYFTANQTANRTVNFTNVNGTLGIGQSMTLTLLATQGSTAYYFNTYQVDGTAVTPKWSGGSAPTGGNASGIDVYTFTIIKTANATFTVLASLTQYA